MLGVFFTLYVFRKRLLECVLRVLMNFFATFLLFYLVVSEICCTFAVLFKGDDLDNTSRNIPVA